MIQLLQFTSEALSNNSHTLSRMDTAINKTAAAAMQVQENIEVLKALAPKMIELQRVANTYLSTVRNSILKRRTEYQVKLSQLKLSEQNLKVEIERNKTARQELLEELAKEMRRRNESSTQVEEMKVQQEAIEKETAEFSEKLEELESQITVKLRQINEQRELLRNQTALVNDRLFQFEQLLGLRIENTGGESMNISTFEHENEEEKMELIKFSFKNVDPEDFTREVSFSFDPCSVSVVSSEPELPKSIYDEATKIFVDSKEIMYLWKFMRASLQSCILESK